MSIAYLRFGGVPIGRGLRERVAWYGDAELMPHLLQMLSFGAVDVTVSWGEAAAYDRYTLLHTATASGVGATSHSFAHLMHRR